MADLMHAILAGLAGWRLASLLVDEDGPFAVFEHLRAWAGLPRVGQLQPRPLIGGILSCVWCASIYTTAGMFAVGEWASWTLVAGVAAAALPPAIAVTLERIRR